MQLESETDINSIVGKVKGFEIDIRIVFFLYAEEGRVAIKKDY